MTADDTGREPDAGERSGRDGSERDRFEHELVVRLGARAGGVGGPDGGPPLAEVRRAGRRRARRRLVVRSGTAAAVLALGTGMVAQFGGPADGAGAVGPVGLRPTGGGATEPATGVVSPFPSRPSRLPTLPPTFGSSSSSSSSSGPDYRGVPSICPEGPASLRLLRWADMTTTPSNWSPPPPRSTPPTRSPDPSSSTSGGQTNRHVVDVQSEIRTLMAADYPDQYFGTCVDLLTNELWVLRVPGGDLDQKVPAAVPHLGVALHFADVPASRRHYLELTTRIKDTDRDYWAARGVTVREVRISEDGTGVSVLTDQADAARAGMLDRYGAEVIEVRPVG
ncbi:hypothetical protein SAMN05216371_3459 [Streptomyces sp. TLI_053]|uniref:hypothetical protein n=1 Tax=Streptomyces sp. TLI_053 TaxID=1855352 RepID=UPI0008793E31|nr:hypothetical protein [Streptomyces sp. TLI_053]SDT65863.1 hypothetical protein SAMN05216371_3459 [Streptomyces sp. TLI_053]